MSFREVKADETLFVFFLLISKTCCFVLQILTLNSSANGNNAFPFEVCQINTRTTWYSQLIAFANDATFQLLVDVGYQEVA